MPGVHQYIRTAVQRSLLRFARERMRHTHNSVCDIRTTPSPLCTPEHTSVKVDRLLEHVNDGLLVKPLCQRRRFGNYCWDRHHHRLYHGLWSGKGDEARVVEGRRQGSYHGGR
jgi:hypothetical protein